jgi:hypothetical protein
MKLPKNDEPEAFWIYQATWVDLQTLKPALTKTFAAAGIQARKVAKNFTPQITYDSIKTVKENKPVPATKAKDDKNNNKQPVHSKQDPAQKSPVNSKAKPPALEWTGLVAR